MQLRSILNVLLVACATVSSSPVFAGPTDTVSSPISIDDHLIDEQHSYVGFKIKYFGFSPVRGRFNTFSGHVLYDPKDIERTSATVLIDVASINTGVEMRDEDLTGEHWFNVEEHPHIRFQSEKVVSSGDGFKVIGNLTIKDMTQQVTISFDQPTAMSKDFAGNDQVDFSGKVTIKRSDFGIVGSGFWNSLMDGGLQQLSDEVEIELDLHCRRPDHLIRLADLEATDVRRKVLDTFKHKNAKAAIEQLELYHRSGKEEDGTELSAGAMNTIGRVLLALGEAENALKVFELKSDRYPGSKTTLVDMAKAYAALGRTEDTVKALENALVQDPTNTRAIELLRHIRMQVNDPR